MPIQFRWIVRWPHPPPAPLKSLGELNQGMLIGLLKDIANNNGFVIRDLKRRLLMRVTRKDAATIRIEMVIDCDLLDSVLVLPNKDELFIQSGKGLKRPDTFIEQVTLDVELPIDQFADNVQLERMNVANAKKSKKSPPKLAFARWRRAGRPSQSEVGRRANVAGDP